MENQICPQFEKGMTIISQRWVGLIIFQLLEGPQRFSVLEENVKVSARVLSERLKSLEEEGIITRKVYPETPVRIEYSLTPKGKALQPVLDSLYAWSHAWFSGE